MDEAHNVGWKLWLPIWKCCGTINGSKQVNLVLHLIQHKALTLSLSKVAEELGFLLTMALKGLTCLCHRSIPVWTLTRRDPMYLAKTIVHTDATWLYKLQRSVGFVHPHT